MKKLLLGFIILLSFIIYGCKYEIESIVYASDLNEFERTKEISMDFKGTVLIEILSEEKFDQTVEMMSGYFKNLKNAKVKKIDYSTFLSGDVSIPIVKVKSDGTFIQDPASLINILFDSTKDKFRLGFSINEEKLNGLKSSVSSQYFQSVDIKDFILKFKITNDKKENVKIYANYLYVNDKPRISEDPYILAPRDNADIRLSDVVKDYVFEKGNYIFLNIDK